MFFQKGDGMSTENYSDYELEKTLEEHRRKKASQFHLNIDEYADEENSSETDFDEKSELNSYSGQEVKEQIARDSKYALKQKRKAEKKERKAKDRHNRFVFRMMWLISVVTVGIMMSTFVVTGINDMLAINRKDSSTVVIDIPKNPTLDTITDMLVKNNIIKEPTYFKMFATLTKATDDFTQGTYEMKKNMDYEAIVNYLNSSGNRKDIVSVTITEGENVLEVANTLSKNGALGEVDKFLELCKSDKFDEDFDFLKAVKNSKDRYYKLEGYLYPDTYEFYVNENPENIIYKFLNNYEVKISEKQYVDGYSKRISIKKMIEKSESKYTVDEIMNIASIIQAEAANAEDMYYVSSIIHNRLEADSDMGVSNLGLDSTKFYPYRNADSVPESESKNYKSKYDTYDKAGLPSGPICNPGMTAIKAAIDPYSTDYYYFCHDSDGNPYYASTIYEHNMNLEYID